MSAEELKALCDLTAELTKLRQAECKQLAVENVAPEILRDLIVAVLEAKGVAPVGSLLCVRCGIQ